MSDDKSDRRTFLQLAAVTAAVGLAGCEETENTAPGDDDGETSPSSPIEEYLVIQEELGESLAELGEANRKLADTRVEFANMIYGVIARGEREIARFSDAPFPPEFDGERIFDVPPELGEQLAGSAFVEYAPESEDEWTHTVARYEDLLIESDRWMDTLMESIPRLQAFWGEHSELFNPEGDGQRTIELHPQFADGEVPLVDSVFLISNRLPIIEPWFPDLWVIIERLLEACEYECVEASVDIVVGYGATLNPYDHAWIKHERTYERECALMETDSYTVTGEWGFYNREVKDESDRDTQCVRSGWTGDCDDDDYLEFRAELEDQIANNDDWWMPWSNCLDWALEMLAIVDDDRADELKDEATSWGFSLPSNLC